VEEKSEHIPVMLRESLEALQIRPEGIYADLTAGERGGHTTKILEQLTTGTIVSFDRDPIAAEKLGRLIGNDSRVRIINENFSTIAEVWEREGLSPADGILIDLGFSSHQIGAADRGFSFQKDGPLTMKYNPSEPGPTAAEYVNGASEEELRNLFFKFGERHGRRIARRIVERREAEPIETTRQLSDIVAKAAPSKPGRNPATLVFLALRSAVNREIEAIEEAVTASLGLLRKGGRLVVITYQSEEDRTVKELLRRASKGCRCELPPDECSCSNPPAARLVTRKVIMPSLEEVESNARSRSAKMRVAEAI